MSAEQIAFVVALVLPVAPFIVVLIDDELRRRERRQWRRETGCPGP